MESIVPTRGNINYKAFVTMSPMECLYFANLYTFQDPITFSEVCFRSMQDGDSILRSSDNFLNAAVQSFRLSQFYGAVKDIYGRGQGRALMQEVVDNWTFIQSNTNTQLNINQFYSI